MQLKLQQSAHHISCNLICLFQTLLKKSQDILFLQKITTPVVYTIFDFFILPRYDNKINDLFHLKKCFLDLKTLTTTKHNNIFCNVSPKNIPEGGQNKIQCSNLFSQSKGHKARGVN